MQKTWVWSLVWEDPLEKGIATHSIILAWGIPWTEEPVGLVCMGSQSQTQLKQLSTHIWLLLAARETKKNRISSIQFSSVTQSCPTLQPHGLKHARLPCPSPTPRACLNSRPSRWWRHPTISSSVIPFSSCLQSFPASGSFPINQFFTSGGQSIRVSASASVLPKNIQDWFPLGWAGWISL